MSGQHVEIRPVRSAEQAQLGAVTVAAYAAALGPALDDGYAQVLRDVAGRATADTVLVAVEGDRVLGGVTYVGDPDSPNAEFPQRDDAGIRYLAVDPAAGGQGLGALLVRACIDWARAEGKHRIVLHTIAALSAAQRLYGRLGFTRAPDLDWEPEPGLHLVAFTYAL